MKVFTISATWIIACYWVERENKFLSEEETFSAGTSEHVQDELERFLRKRIARRAISVRSRWSGTMAVGKEKKPIVQKSATVYSVRYV
jgi:hypothetical protein